MSENTKSIKLSTEHLAKLKQLKDQVGCTYAENCTNTPLSELPKIHEIGTNGLLECLDKRARLCPFALPFGNSFFCKCPARSYLFRTVGV